MFVPYLAYGCGTIDFNIERVSGYFANLCDVCGDLSHFRLYGNIECDCPPLSWDPYTTNVDTPGHAIPVRYTNPAGDDTVLVATVTGAVYGGNGYITFTADNTFEVGQIVSINGIDDGAWLNPEHFVVTEVTPTTFSGYLPCTVCDNTDPVVTTPVGTTWQWASSGSYLAGPFTVLDGVSSGGVGFVDDQGNVDAAFSAAAGTGFDTPSYTCMLVQPDGKVLIGGYFSTYNGTNTPYFTRLNTDGTIDTTFVTNMGSGFDGPVTGIALQSDDKIVCVGDFVDFDGNYCNYIVRLNTDGTWDSTFATPSPGGYFFDNYTDKVLVESDGTIVVATSSGFNDYDGTPVDGMTRINPDGTFHSTFPVGAFHSGFNSNVNGMALFPDGKIVVGGDFLGVNNLSNPYIVRFNADGTVDSTYSANAQAAIDYTVYAVDVQTDGKVVVGGDFTGYVKRLNADGTEDTAFTTALGSGVVSTAYDVAVRDDGKILIGGWMLTVDGTTVNYVALLNSDGSLNGAYTTNTGTGADSSVEVIGLKGLTSPVTATLHQEVAAPWYDPDVPESARFLGYIIEDLTGLESPTKRNITTKLSGSGGGVFGPYRNEPRQFQITALLFGCDIEAMDYGFRYLKDSLGYWACSKCETCNLEIATACQTFDLFSNGYYETPLQDDVLRNRWYVYRASIVEGPMYADEPIPDVGCNIRRVQFVIAAEDPWLYQCPTDLGTFIVGSSGNEEPTALCNSTGVTASITNVVGSGSVVTYTASNTFQTDDVVTITGVDPTVYNLTNATVLDATSTSFTVVSNATGTYNSPSPPADVATLVHRGYDTVHEILPVTNIGEIAVNVTVTNPSTTTATSNVSISLYPDSLGYQYRWWQGLQAVGSAVVNTPLTIGVGTVVSLTLPNVLGYAVGSTVHIVKTNAGNTSPEPTYWMEGPITSISGNTITFTATSANGTGDTSSYWAVSQPVPPAWEPTDRCARVVISTIPAGYSFTIDSSSERYTLTAPSGDVYDGTPYIKVEPGTTPEFLTARCSRYALSVSGSYTELACGTYYTVETQHREI
jgi:uncharacterized delta-60 repeat protein